MDHDKDYDVIIVGGGISGLSCARILNERGISVLVIEKTGRPGGRVKTDREDGFLFDRGFQVLQTAYPEAQRFLNYQTLDLRTFVPGAVIRVDGSFYTIADPFRSPQNIIGTMTAPIGSLADRWRLLRLASKCCRGPLDNIFQGSDAPSKAFLRAEGFSDIMINRFFVPFFGGVCLDPEIQASSRVLKYVLRMFARGDAALPAEGMEAIPRQMADGLPPGCIRTGTRVVGVESNQVSLEDGTKLMAKAIVLATEGLETKRLLDLPQKNTFRGEICHYFACGNPTIERAFLILNGEGVGPINNMAIPSLVAPGYAPKGESLISVVSLGASENNSSNLLKEVRLQLIEWFGQKAARWRHLRTYRIKHALPDQSPPTQDPTGSISVTKSGVWICGEHRGLPGIQWALASGRRVAEAIIRNAYDVG